MMGPSPHPKFPVFKGNAAKIALASEFEDETCAQTPAGARARRRNPDRVGSMNRANARF
jgi:hypothetical protein